VTHVVDTSVVVKWFVAEEGQDKAERLIGTPLIAPDLIMAEVSNAVWKKWRKGEMAAEQARVAQAMVSSFVEMVPSRPFAEAALAIAIELEHAVYDCFYLALCEASERRMITADQRLIKRCAGTRFAALLDEL
jgi:predicted nucleic acid-binding protein